MASGEFRPLQHSIAGTKARCFLFAAVCVGGTTAEDDAPEAGMKKMEKWEREKQGVTGDRDTLVPTTFSSVCRVLKS